MGRGVRRNAPCWCGSGKKFKSCHAGRENETPKPVGQLYSEFRGEFSKKYCLAPNAPDGCAGKIVRAHTVQRSGSLELIAEDGLLLQMNVHPEVLSKTGGLPEPRKIGINQGSTFTGFCAYHDSTLFRVLETQPFVGSPEQCRLLTYRAVCRELFQKRAALKAIDAMRSMDRGRAPLHQMAMQNQIAGMLEGTRAGLRTIEQHKLRIDSALQGEGASHGSGLVIWLSDIPSVMCSGGVYPDEDFGGAPLQDLGDTELDSEFVAFTMFASNGKGIAAFSWEDDSQRCASKLVESLSRKPRRHFADLFVLFAFEYLENTLFSPAWWGALDSKAQERLQSAVLSGAPYVPSRRGLRLALGRKKLATWAIESVERV